VINKGSTKVNTYAKKQNNLTSQILDCGTTYDGHKPMIKHKHDPNNNKDDLRRTDHQYSDLFGQSGTGGRRSPNKKRANDLNEGTKFAKSPVKDMTNATSKGTKHANLTSSLDTHSFQAVLKKEAV
jgi:hypothetical protein